MLVMFPLIFVADTKTIYGYNFVVPLKKSIGFLLSMFTFKPGKPIKLNCSTTFGWSFHWFALVGGSAIGAVEGVFCRFITGSPNVSIKSSLIGSIERVTTAAAVRSWVGRKASPPLVLTHFRGNWSAEISSFDLDSDSVKLGDEVEHELIESESPIQNHRHYLQDLPWSSGRFG